MEIPGRQSLMIGSMPQKNPEEAFKILNQYPLSIPTWPQLPKRSFKEGMIPQYIEGFPGIRVDEENKRIWLERDSNLINNMTIFYEKIISEDVNAFAISEEYAAGLFHFLNGMENKSAKFPLIKGQVTGPFTLGLGLNDNGGKAVWFDIQYRDVVLKGIAAKALWVINQLKKYAERVIIFFDEPILSALGTPAYIGIQDKEVINCLNEVINMVHSAGAFAGIHCCGNMDWGLLARTSVDIISFDAYFFCEKVALYPDEIKTFLEREGILAWGIVPTNDHETLLNENPESLKKLLNRFMELFVKKGIPEDRIKKQIIFTPSCGIGSLSEEDSTIILDLLSKITKE